MIIKLFYNLFSQIKTIWSIFLHSFKKSETVKYPEEKIYLPPRYRGRIIMTKDNNGEERCVACNLCAVVCPVSCISLQKAEKSDGRWYPKFFRINFSRCIFCGFCEESCPTSAIQLIPDFELGEYKRKNLIYNKEDLLISGLGKDHNYNYYDNSGIKTIKKRKSNIIFEYKPIDVKTILP